MSKIEDFLKAFMSSWQVASIYTVEHPEFKESLKGAYQNLNDILSTKGGFTIGIFEKEFASGDEIFFELSRKLQRQINFLKDRGIERIIFNQGTSKEELIQFISFLLFPKEKIQLPPSEFIYKLGVKNIRIDRLGYSEGAQKTESGKVPVGVLENYEVCLEKVARSLDQLIDDDVVDYISLRFTANTIMENLIGNYQEFFRLMKVKSKDVVTFMHILNVSVLATYFAYRLDFERKDCMDIGMAALFHDIGKLYISRKIIQKPGKLDEEEFGKIKSHTTLGSEILLKHLDSLGTLPPVVAFEHHLKYNLEGYPRVNFKRDLHVASLIVSICDVYDALVQRRSYKNPFPPELIYEIMSKGKGKDFHPGLLDKFFSIMGVWPKGTIVLLKGGNIGIVREENEDDIFCPKIEIVKPKTEETIDLKENKDVEIEKSLNPLAEGSEYVDLI